MNEAYIFLVVIYSVFSLVILSLFARDLFKWLKSRRAPRIPDGVVDITKIPEEELNNDYRIAHNEREFCEMAMFAGLKEYNGVDLAEQIMKANTIMEKIMSEINRRGLTQHAFEALPRACEHANMLPSEPHGYLYCPDCGLRE